MLHDRTIRYEDGTPRTHHVTTNFIITTDDRTESATTTTTATARSYVTVFQAVPGLLPLQPIAAGRYRDRFACHDGRWRFAERHVDIHLTGDVSHHLRP